MKGGRSFLSRRDVDKQQSDSGKGEKWKSAELYLFKNTLRSNKDPSFKVAGQIFFFRNGQYYNHPTISIPSATYLLSSASAQSLPTISRSNLFSL